jgi:hypothetical protein
MLLPDRPDSGYHRQIILSTVLCQGNLAEYERNMRNHYADIEKHAAHLLSFRDRCLNDPQFGLRQANTLRCGINDCIAKGPSIGMLLPFHGIPRHRFERSRIQQSIF